MKDEETMSGKIVGWYVIAYVASIVLLLGYLAIHSVIHTLFN